MPMNQLFIPGAKENMLPPRYGDATRIEKIEKVE
jgi:hypothetical protein